MIPSPDQLTAALRYLGWRSGTADWNTILNCHSVCVKSIH
jgi:hypothetical protein